jgi:hypothetical protein
MEAQNASERKKSKKGRQYPTPPTGSKASRLGITKKFINFLLEHDEANLCVSTHGNQKKDTCPCSANRGVATAVNILFIEPMRNRESSVVDSFHPPCPGA